MRFGTSGTGHRADELVIMVGGTHQEPAKSVGAARAISTSSSVSRSPCGRSCALYEAQAKRTGVLPITTARLGRQRASEVERRRRLQSAPRPTSSAPDAEPNLCLVNSVSSARQPRFPVCSCG